MGLFSKYLPLLCMLIFFIIVCDAYARVNVLITNEMSNYEGKPNVTIHVHCRSKHDDLGPHEVAFLQSYQFSFIPSYIQNTIFRCGVKWDGDARTFVAFDKIRDRKKCKICLWNITPKHPCVYNYDTRSYDCAPWEDWLPLQ